MPTLADILAPVPSPLYKEGAVGMGQHPDMAVLGPQAWAELHAWAERLRAQVGDSCGCGKFAISGARALHDLVNHELGKPVMYPEDLKRMAREYEKAAGAVGAHATPERRRVSGRQSKLGQLQPSLFQEETMGMAEAYAQAAGVIGARQEEDHADMEAPAPFGWPGGKRLLKHRIITLIPPHKTYVEPFCGAASVFWAKEPSLVEVLNDIDPDLMRFYQNIGAIRQCDIQQLAQDWEGLKAKQGQLAPCEFLAAVDCSFGSGRLERGQALSNTTCSSGASHFHKGLPEYQARLQKTRLHQGDWEDVVHQYDAPDTFFYFDPPYHGTSRLYAAGSRDVLGRLAQVLPTLKGKWLLSYDNHPDVRAAFNGVRIEEVETTYTIAAGSNTQKGKELLIMNYQLSVASLSQKTYGNPKRELSVGELAWVGEVLPGRPVFYRGRQGRVLKVERLPIVGWPDAHTFPYQLQFEDGEKAWFLAAELAWTGSWLGQAALSQSFLDTIVNSALATATSIGVAKALSASVVPGGVSPDPSHKEEDDKPKEKVMPPVIDVDHVQGDQAQVEGMAGLLTEIDKLLQDKANLGEVDADRLEVTRQ